VMEGLGKI